MKQIPGDLLSQGEGFFNGVIEKVSPTINAIVESADDIALGTAIGVIAAAVVHNIGKKIAKDIQKTFDAAESRY